MLIEVLVSVRGWVDSRAEEVNSVMPSVSADSHSSTYLPQLRSFHKFIFLRPLGSLFCYV